MADQRGNRRKKERKEKEEAGEGGRAFPSQDPQKVSSQANFNQLQSS